MGRQRSLFDEYQVSGLLVVNMGDDTVGTGDMSRPYQVRILTSPPFPYHQS